MCPQSEEALQATRFLLPRSPGFAAFLYTEDLVFACSTGTSRAALPDEKISFSSPGETDVLDVKCERWQTFRLEIQSFQL